MSKKKEADISPDKKPAISLTELRKNPDIHAVITHFDARLSALETKK